MTYQTITRTLGSHLKSSTGVLALAALMTALSHGANAETAPLASNAAQPASATSSAAKPAPQVLMAQAVSPNSPAQASSIETVTVTGSHIVGGGYQSPTPLSVMTAQDIDTYAPTNIADLVNQMPAVAGSTVPQTGNTSISAGTSGINALNLRDLGTSRTLVLLDGRRSVPSTVTGQVDVSDIPQGLIQRIDVVTGGASAVYGSDAVSGVVNFVLNKDYTGIKGNIEGGETTYGDDLYRKASLTAGETFFGDRLHVLLNGEYLQSDGIYGPQRTRKWDAGGNYMITNPAYTATNGQPQFLVTANAGLSNATPGGIITNTALRGTTFGVGGVPGQFAYGSAVLDPWMIGGAWPSVQVNNTQSLDPDQHRKGAFGRATYALTDDVNVYVEAAWNQNYTKGWVGIMSNQGNVTINSDNAYIPASVATQLNAQGIKSFTLGTTNADLGSRITDDTRTVERFVFGADGDFDLLGRNFKWNGYAQYGDTNTNEGEVVTNNARLALAQDAVVVTPANVAKSGLALGNIVCRDTLANPADGCVPLDRLGTGVATPAAIAYVEEAPNYPFRDEYFREAVAAFNVSGTLFDDWQGPVSLATGIEHRKESVSGYVPLNFQSGWFNGNYLPNFGNYNVTEGYVETEVPLWTGLDLNAAARVTGYSTSGVVTTWKGGLTYQAFDWLRLRTTESRDIRAPNLSELFAAGTKNTNNVQIPGPLPGAPGLVANQTIQYVGNTTGNPNLKPEIARTFGGGVVLTPDFIPNFNLSVDYYDIEIKGGIGSVSAQTIVNNCYLGQSQYCSAIVYGTLAGGVPTISQINIVPFNFTQQKARGIDFEASYLVPLEDLHAPFGGSLTLHAMATNYLENLTNNGLNPPTDTAGQNDLINNGGGVPNWIYRLTATYTNDPWTFALNGHGVSAGTYNNSNVVCQTGCPASTVNNPTINANRIAGAFYLGASISYDFGVYGLNTQAYFVVDNLANSPPAIDAEGPAGSAYGNSSANPQYYDVIGRMFRVGLRFNTQ